MAFKMKKCPHCEKSMPPHILAKHLVKSHSVPTEQESVDQAVKEGVLWDWGEVIECGVCKERWPNKLLRFHLRIEHGI